MPPAVSEKTAISTVREARLQKQDWLSDGVQVINNIRHGQADPRDYSDG